MEDYVFDRSKRTRLRKMIYLTILMVSLTTTLYLSKGVEHSASSLEKRAELDRQHVISNGRSSASDQAENDTGNTTVKSSIAMSSSTTTSTPTVARTSKSTKPLGKTTKSTIGTSSTTTTKAAGTSSTVASTTSATTLSTLSKITLPTLKTSTIKTPSTTTKSNKSTKANVKPAVVLPTMMTNFSPVPSTTVEPDCEEPAYHEFPEDIFTNKQRAGGAVIVHILVGIYMFYALAVVCDEYFVTSMEKICEKMGLSEDVAGATFMAAGSSAPELFASVLGVFVAKGDVGTGTIVGSAVFNVLFVIGFCGLFCGRVIPLNWWPLLRDSVCYTLAVVVLIVVLADGKITWLESFIMLLFYAAYIVVMKYNFKLRMWLTENTRLREMDELTQSAHGMLMYDDKQIRSSYVQFSNDQGNDSSWKNDVGGHQQELDEIIRDYPRKMTLYEAAQKVMMSRYFSPRTRFRCAARRLIIEYRFVCRNGYPDKAVTIHESHYTNPKILSNEMSKETREAWKTPPTVEQNGLFEVICWLIKIPVLATLHYTIPDCRDRQWEQWFMSTFAISLIWIAFFSYILVWMVTLIGYTFGIPDTIMGITFLAAGTSIPDAYASLLVAKQGLGDMAIANSIGSNVFDILVGLAFPWFLGTAVIGPNPEIYVSSRGLVYNVVLLFLSIVIAVSSVHYCRWQLNERLGFILLSAYAVFLFFSMLIEFNVFGYVNPPECEE